jgi:hypothetical protein
MLAFNLKSLNTNASALIEARGQSASAGVRSALENVQDLHYYAESPLGHVMRYVLALTTRQIKTCKNPSYHSVTVV